MQKIEEYLDKFSWLLKLGIWLVLILWGVQFSHVLVLMYEEGKNQPKRDIVKEEKFSREYHKLYKKLLAGAKAKGDDYGPQDYFEDYKAIKSLQLEIGLDYDSEPFMLSTDIPELQRLSIMNIGSGEKYTLEDAEMASREFNVWFTHTVSGRKEFDEMLDRVPLKDRWFKVFDWLISLYKRGFFLVFLLYLVRMSQRKGILETILADKKMFFFLSLSLAGMYFQIPI